jgi:surface protein
LKQKKRIPNKTKIMSLDHDRILNDIKEARHAVNMDSIRKHHRDIWTLLHGDDKAEEKLNSITKPLQSFITAWRVNTTLVLPLVPGEPYDFLVKWGDGSGEEKIKLLRGWNADEKNTNTYTHVYTRADVYTVTITGAIRGFHRTGGIENRSLCAEYSEDGVLVSVKQWGLVQLTSCQNMFRNSRNADLIYECNAPDLRWCTDMSGMFRDSEKFNCNISKWDVSNITNMSSMFHSRMFADNQIFNCDISKWDVSNVTNMSFMFHGCTVFNQPIGNWNVGKVIRMSHMFCNCYNFDQPIGDWNVSFVTNMSCMFRGCRVFNQTIDKWNVSKVTTMSLMFGDCRAFNQPIYRWDVSKVESMSHMFYMCHSFNRKIGGWDVSKVTHMSSMFHGCHTFNQPIGGWNVAKVRAMRYMFHSCYAFNQPLWWDVSEVIYMTGMFLDCKKFNKPIGGWEVNKVRDVSTMFYGCIAFDQYMGGWMFSSGLPMFESPSFLLDQGI